MHRLLPRLLIGSALCLAATAPASAHAKLVHSSPAAGSVVATPPADIVLEFSEPVEAKLSHIDLRDSKDAKADVGPPTLGSDNAAALVAPIIRRLPPGTYQVEWHAISKDMHKVWGRFDFTVGP